MRFRVPVIYDRAMDAIAMVLFPSRRYVTLTLALYFVLLAVGAVWLTGNWLWLIAVALCAAMAWIIDRWM